jgi:hypothetical protein
MNISGVAYTGINLYATTAKMVETKKIVTVHLRIFKALFILFYSLPLEG